MTQHGKRGFVGLVMGAIAATVALPALAQTNETQQLQHQIQLLRREIADLQRMVFKGEAPANVSAAVSEGGDVPASIAGQLQVKMQRLEAQLRALTGSYEEMDNRIRSVEARLDKLVTDIDFRLRSLEEGGPMAGNTQPQPPQQELNTTAPINAPADGQQTTIITSQGAQGPAAPRAPQTLGTLTQDDLAAVQPGGTAAAQPQQQGQQTASAPVNADTPEGHYQQAMTLLHKRDLDGAETALRSFLDSYPDDKLAGNARYWLGETYYARKQYAEAARVFSDAYLNDKQGSKATHSLLKLAMSLEQVGQAEASCVAYLELISKHPDTEPRILDRAKSARNKLNCQ